ncbi:HAD family hydrolase [Pasteurellaceae bacterium Pebbles2]|nr:HAD family hydrolase [Pasteurellaceae bacterium Pebbles2]
MKFYRTFSTFKLISFDLDDTLYDNHQVIRLAEQQCVERLRQLSQISQLDRAEWQMWKEKTAVQNPLVCENVTQWRINTIQNLLQHYGKSAVQITQISHDVMQHFLDWRHKINVPTQSISVLEQLKKRFPLVAITNGNVDPARIGLTQFEQLFCGGVQGRAKPDADLFHQVARQYNIVPNEILHVGDNLITDVQGAIQAGCQAAWINLSQQNFAEFDDARCVPTLEINDLEELLTLQIAK